MLPADRCGHHQPQEYDNISFHLSVVVFAAKVRRIPQTAKLSPRKLHLLHSDKTAEPCAILSAAFPAAYCLEEDLQIKTIKN